MCFLNRGSSNFIITAPSIINCKLHTRLMIWTTYERIGEIGPLLPVSLYGELEKCFVLVTGQLLRCMCTAVITVMFIWWILPILFVCAQTGEMKICQSLSHKCVGEMSVQRKAQEAFQLSLSATPSRCRPILLAPSTNPTQPPFFHPASQAPTSTTIAATQSPPACARVC